MHHFCLQFSKILWGGYIPPFLPLFQIFESAAAFIETKLYFAAAFKTYCVSFLHFTSLQLMTYHLSLCLQPTGVLRYL